MAVVGAPGLLVTFDLSYENAYAFKMIHVYGIKEIISKTPEFSVFVKKSHLLPFCFACVLFTPSIVLKIDVVLIFDV